jgi:hypothetical protein
MSTVYMNFAPQKVTLQYYCAIIKLIHNWKSRNKYRCAMDNPGKIVFAQFPQEWSLHRSVSSLKIKDDLSKKVTLPLAIDSEFFIARLLILVRSKTKGPA